MLTEEALEKFSKDLDNIVPNVEPSQKEFLKAFALCALSIALCNKFAEIYVDMIKEKDNEHRNIGSF